MFGRADACFTDLETAIRTPLAEAPTRQGVFLHAADPAVLDCLKALSISLVATANNPAWDLGTGGIIGALAEIETRGFTHAGAGAGLTAAAAPAFRRTANGTVGLVAAASGRIRDGAAATAVRAGVNEIGCTAGVLDAQDLARTLAAIADAAGQADVVIAYHHNHVLDAGGRETPAWQRAFARQCIDAGASLFVSHGAPRLRGIEIYCDRPIFYDLGSLIFQTATPEGFYDDAVWQSVVAECRFVDGSFRELILTPIRLHPGTAAPGGLVTRGLPSIARGAEGRSILDRLAGLSRPFGTIIEPNGGTATVRAG